MHDALNPLQEDSIENASVAMSKTPRVSWLFCVGLTLIHLVLLLIQMSRHVMWRDELHQWQVLWPLGTLRQAAKALRYDGVPPLWNGIVFLLTRMSDDPRILQLLHALIASAVTFVFVRWSPFSRLAKVLFPLGYFMLFEYGVITRSYSLLFLLMLISCALIARDRLNLLLLTGVLLLLIETSIWGAGFAILLFAYALHRHRPGRGKGIVASAALLCGLAICAISVTPGPGTFFAPRRIFVPITQRLLEVLGTIWNAFAPIPRPGQHFWNSNILDGFLIVQAIVGLALLVLLIAQFHRSRPVQILFCLGTAGLLGFAMLFPGFTRHHGHLFMLFVVCAWLANQTRSVVLQTTFVLQAIVGICFAVAAFQRPFTDSKRIAQYIQSNFDVDRVVLMGIPDYSVSPLTQWLGQQIYFPEMRRYAWVNTQSDEERPGVKPRRLLPVIYEMMQTWQKPALLISESGFKPWDADCVVPVNPDIEGSPKVRIKVYPTFDEGIEKTESGLIYLISEEK